MSMHFTHEHISTLETRLALLHRRGKISEADAQTVRSVFTRPVFRQFLESTAGEQAKDCIEALATQEITEALQSFEQLRKLCMGVWLENCSSFAIDEAGEMQVKIDEEGVSFSETFTHHLDTKKDGVTSTYYRQAALRQIERHYLMQANGLFEEDFHPKRIADIGAGTLIASAMMRDQNPDASIVAYEPGLVSDKSRAIAQAKQITLCEEPFRANPKAEKFDLIMLHFVLEHDIDDARDMIRQALRMLAPGGKISVGVPNFHAFHREYELEKGLSKRDPKTRLSFHDGLSGHQIIFTPEQLSALIREVQMEEGVDVPLQVQSILPRPLSFNEMMKHSSDDVLLDRLEREGHPCNLPDRGSVLAITVGSPSRYRTPISEKNATEAGTAFGELMGLQQQAQSHRINSARGHARE